MKCLKCKYRSDRKQDFTLLRDKVVCINCYNVNRSRILAPAIESIAKCQSIIALESLKEIINNRMINLQK